MTVVVVVLGLELWPLWRLLVSGTVRVEEETGSNEGEEPPLLLGLPAAQLTSLTLLVCLAADTRCWIGLPLRTCIMMLCRMQMNALAEFPCAVGLIVPATALL
jgi:hypothetical protein